MVATIRDSLLDGAGDRSIAEVPSDMDALQIVGETMDRVVAIGAAQPDHGQIRRETTNGTLQIRTEDGWRSVGEIAGGVIMDIERNQVVSGEIDLDVPSPQEKPAKKRKTRGPRIIIIEEDR